MAPKEIPGFYFDRKKGRYFKVAPNQHASSRQYSVDRVNRIKREEELSKARLKKSIKEKRERIQRSKISKSSLGYNLCLAREIQPCSSQVHHFHRAKAFIEGLQQTTYDITSSLQDESENAAHISHFDVDPENGEAYFGSSSNNEIATHRLCKTKFRFSASSNLSTLRVPKSCTAEKQTLWPLNSEISSVNVCNTSRTVIATTIGSFSAPEIYVMPMGDGAQSNLKLRNNTTLWTSALTSKVPNVSPSNFAETVAIGTSVGILTLKYNRGDFDVHVPVSLKNLECLSLDWVTSQTLAAGTRSGSVHLWDNRSDGSSVALQHPTPITSIRRCNDPNQLLVAGLRRSMAIYDLRMQATDIESGARGTKRAASKPLLLFDCPHTNSTALGLDVHQSLELVAASDDKCNIVVHSLKTGKVMRTFENSGFQPNNSRVRCLRFSDDGHGRPTLMASLDQRIIEYHWA